jgi:hypothetical protein
MKAAGFHDPELRGTFDSFRGTSKESTARKFGVLGANFIAFR